jgi:hypothetical protein
MIARKTLQFFEQYLFKGDNLGLKQQGVEGLQ